MQDLVLGIPTLLAVYLAYLAASRCSSGQPVACMQDEDEGEEDDDEEAEDEDGEDEEDEGKGPTHVKKVQPLLCTPLTGHAALL